MDRLVCGVISDKTRFSLLKKTDLSLKKALDICRAAKAVSTQIKLMATQPMATTSTERAEDMDVKLLKTR